MKCLIIHTHPQSIESLSGSIDAAKQISEDVDLLLIGDYSGIDKLGVTKIFHYPKAKYPDPKGIHDIIKDLAKDYSHIISHSDTTSKDFLPYYCGKEKLPMISEVRSILSPNTFQRAIYAGDAYETIETKQPQVILSIRGIYFLNTHEGHPEISTHQWQEQTYPKILKEPTIDHENIDLSTADVVVSGGRGFGSKESFDQLYDLAKHFNAGVGASRAAVDAGYISNDHQVGQTGKQIAPRLYFSFGISGAVQHLSGMKDSQTIIAVDKDPDAPIFKIAQYGYSGDLFEAIAELRKNELK